MTRLRSRWLLGIALVGLLVSSPAVLPQAVAPAQKSAPAALPQDISGVGNFAEVGAHLCRGAQPTVAGFAELARRGVTVVVNLRHEDANGHGERALVEAQGMRYVAIPISGIGVPTHEQVAEFLRLVASEPAQKVFVHCRRGAERTGTMVAAYRIAVDGWPASQALAEMKTFRFAHRWYPGLVRFVMDFPSTLQRDPAYAFLSR